VKFHQLLRYELPSKGNECRNLEATQPLKVSAGASMPRIWRFSPNSNYNINVLIENSRRGILPAGCDNGRKKRMFESDADLILLGIFLIVAVLYGAARLGAPEDGGDGAKDDASDEKDT
jgi:hypothetical protein